VDGDGGREILDKMDKLVQSLSKWAVNSEFSEEPIAQMNWKHSNITSLLNKYKIEDDSKNNDLIKGEDLKELVAFSKSYERFMLNKPI